jgi:hypothetical protein
MEIETSMATANVLVAMGGEDERELRPRFERRPEALARLRVEGSCRLVEECEGGIPDESPGESQLLNHARRASIDSLHEDGGELELLFER